MPSQREPPNDAQGPTLDPFERTLRREARNPDATALPERRAALEDFDRAVQREVHNLSPRPDLLWQQLCNRLQWSEGRARELVNAEAERRAADRDRPIWFRSRTPFREAEALLRTLRHEGVRTCALAPTGAFLSSSGWGSLRLWDTRTGVELASAVDSVESCAFDCDGNFLVTGNDDGRVRIRDARTLTELTEVHVEGGEVYCATSPLEPVAAIASGTVLRLVELPSGHERVSSAVKGGAFSCCAFFGDLIVTGDDAGAVIFWLSGLDKWELVSHAHSSPIRGCAVSPNGRFIATAGDDEVKIWWSGGNSAFQQFAQVNDCAFSPDGHLLVSVSDDRTVWVRKVDHRPREALMEPISVLEGHSAPVVRCTFAANGSMLATASRDGSVKLWDPWRAPSRGGLTGHHERVTAVAFAPDGSSIVSASADMTLKTWDPAPTAERSTLEGHVREVWDCVFLRGGSVIASAAWDGTVRLWDLKSAGKGQVVHVGHDVHALACSPDGLLLAVGHDRSVSLFELGLDAFGDIAAEQRRSEAEVGRPGPPGLDCRVQDCAFTPDGRRVLVACEDGTLRVWDAPTWRELTVLRGHTDSVSCCAAVPESSFAVSGSKDGTLRLWDVEAERELHVFTGHTAEIWDCAVSADGAMVVSVGWDGMLLLWDIASRTPIATYSVPARLRSVALHPSEHRVAFGDVDGWIRVVDVMGLHLRRPEPTQGGTVRAVL